MTAFCDDGTCRKKATLSSVSIVFAESGRRCPRGSILIATANVGDDGREPPNKPEQIHNWLSVGSRLNATGYQTIARIAGCQMGACALFFAIKSLGWLRAEYIHESRISADQHVRSRSCMGAHISAQPKSSLSPLGWEVKRKTKQRQDFAGLG